MRPARRGNGLARFLTGRGIRCVVAAPSKMHRPSGDRLTIDARDALLLAWWLRLREIRAVTVPSLAQEAARDLVRVREDVRADLMRARHRTSKLLRQGILSSGGTAWTSAHEQWLGHQRFRDARVAGRLRHDAGDGTAGDLPAGPARQGIIERAHEPPWWPRVSRLQCLRGVSMLTAFGLAVEVRDWSRFSDSRIGAYLGLVPTENSSGDSRHQGSITKAGKTHARRCKPAASGGPQTAS